MKSKILALLLLTAIAASVQAVPITFNLRDTTKTVEIESGIINRGGVIVTLTPSVSGSGGVLNQTADNFGVNATLSDVTDRLDGIAGAESISIVFDKNVLFTGLTLSSFSGAEGASLKINGFLTLPLADTGSGTDVYSFAANNNLAVGQTVQINWASGNGFSFDSFTVEIQTAVPDTGTTAILLSLPLLGFWTLRRFTTRPV